MKGSMSEITEIIGRRIRDYREGQKMSRETLAELADLHPTYIAQLERGEKNATINTLDRVCNALGITMEQLFEKINNQPKRNTISCCCYNLVHNQSPQKQKHLYAILKEIVNLESIR